jgi:cell division protein FtsA
MLASGLTPKMRPLSGRRSYILSALDIGTTKTACIVARLRPLEGNELLPGRTHTCEILGFGHQRSGGVKAGTVVDMEAAERSIRLAVDAAERMAGVHIDSVVLSVAAGRLASEAYAASVQVVGHPVQETDIRRVLTAGSAHSVRTGRAVLHSLPTGFALDATRHVRDPRGMVGTELSVDMNVVTGDVAPMRNLMLTVERCHIDVEAMVAAPYASALASLVDDEAEIGTTVIDFGGGTTSVAVFAGGHFVHVDAVALGGNHVTMDVARGLSIGLEDAERVKTLHGSVIAHFTDEGGSIPITPIGEDASVATTHLSRAELFRIVRPRVEETLELVRDRLRKSGWAVEARRVVITGGASQLTGLPDLARSILGRPVRMGRPLGARGLPDLAKGAAFAASVGLLVYPQVAGLETLHSTRMQRAQASRNAAPAGYFARVGQWLKESF